MRTVIIATKQHIDDIERYRLFFEPFINSDIKFCEWHPEEKEVKNIIPDIYKCVAAEKDWRAILLYDAPNTRSNLNPFDLVEYTEVVEAHQDPSNQTKEGEAKTLEEKEKWFESQLRKKENRLKECYDKAKDEPLTRLASFLCEAPLDASEQEIKPEKERPLEFEGDLVTEKKEDTYVSDLLERRRVCELNYYKRVANYKKELRDKIVGENRIRVFLPKEVNCIAWRTMEDSRVRNGKLTDLAWRTTTEVQYSDFVDRNMYFDRMRFFVYDILHKEHANYHYDHLKFIYTLLIFAGSKMPSDAVLPERLYCLNSTCEEDSLRELVLKYDQKLENTVKIIEDKEAEILGQYPGPMNDDDAELLFHSQERIEVSLDKRVKLNGFYVEPERFGLAYDCPANERNVWREMYTASDEAMRRLMKQPRRSLERAIGKLRMRCKESFIEVLGLNHFQVEDIREYTEIEEDRMVSIHTKDFYDISRYEAQMSEGSENVKSVIATRMTKKVTVILGLLAILLFFVGFIPVIFFNREVIDIIIPIGLTVVALLLLALVGLISLFIYRSELRGKAVEYNEVMSGIHKDVDESMELFTNYLSHACHVMRGNFALAECERKDNVFKQKIRILRSHVEQIRDRQSQLRELFGEYVGEHPRVDAGDSYLYDFEIAKEYDYPIPFVTNKSRQIPFFTEGNKTEVPLVIVDRIDVNMEELYE